ncbi:MAG: single-stranded DNA-binding protein [Candidatus Nitronauta litoralis]|uniref:Single-stranded DNA-binding protein n=1 Tax=Candidatus Nitronauta litoralis TaxID=2705533 RepID=A0A7T0BZ54_9BACT|nr:MAG: single-stranded DNA-binding protein [Candidatus Nitronauta litoralis]
MASYNKVLLMGNLTRDPELRFTASGAAVASFGLAVNRKYKSGDEWKEDVCFVDITVWGRTAENCTEYLNKGSGVFIEGRLNFQSWEAQDGQKRNKLEVVANVVQFLGKSGSGKPSMDMDGGGGGMGEGAPPKDDIPF